MRISQNTSCFSRYKDISTPRFLDGATFDFTVFSIGEPANTCTLICPKFSNYIILPFSSKYIIELLLL